MSYLLMSAPAILLVAGTLVVSAVYFYDHPYRHPSRPQNLQKAQAYIIHSHVTHARLLPSTSHHSFAYPTFFLLLSLSALESHSLDLLPFFRYGSRGALTSIRSAPYFFSSPTMKILEKLRTVLIVHGLDADRVGDAWMLTMPALMGWAGINPLTVYYCYTKEGDFWLSVLEIHNTFGESHVHFLERGVGEDAIPAKGYDHQWTFPRAFHVSPFNRRSGFYTVSITLPFNSPSAPASSSVSPQSTFPTHPAVRVNLYTARSPSCPSASITPGPLKLTASIRPHASGVCVLTHSSLLMTFARMPFALALTFLRIVWQAAVLHYQKRLDVFARPEPLPLTSVPLTSNGFPLPNFRPDTSCRDTNVYGGGDVKGGGVRWQQEDTIERYARMRVQAFLSQRAKEEGITIKVDSGDPHESAAVFPPGSSLHFRGQNRSNGYREDEYTDGNPIGSASKQDLEQLTIVHLSPRFYVQLLLAPSAAHALLLAAHEGEFTVSSRELFIRIFRTPSSVSTRSISQRLRASVLPSSIPLPVPAAHPFNSTLDTFIVLLLLALARLERAVFSVVGARFVKGTEPWGAWERVAINMAREQGALSPVLGEWVGSVVRER